MLDRSFMILSTFF